MKSIKNAALCKHFDAAVWSDSSFAVVIRAYTDIDQILRRFRIALITAGVAFDVKRKTVFVGYQEHQPPRRDQTIRL